MEALPPKALLFIVSVLFTALSAVVSFSFMGAKKTLEREVNRFINRLESVALDVNKLKEDFNKQAKVLYEYRMDINNDITMNKDVIVKTFTDAREKTFERINELQNLSNEIQANTTALAEVFRANAEELEVRIQGLITHRDEIKETYGKVIILEDRVNKHQTAIRKVGGILKANGLLKKG
jgi:methyl-accepting chemotaxis protein